MTEDKDRNRAVGEQGEILMLFETDGISGGSGWAILDTFECKANRDFLMMNVG